MAGDGDRGCVAGGDLGVDGVEGTCIDDGVYEVTGCWCGRHGEA